MAKTKTNSKIIALVLIFFLIFGLSIWPNFSKPTQANNWGEVIINEIMWMGSSSSSSDEWLELRNLTNYDINFSQTNWKIYKNDVLMVTLSQGILYANDYFLIARKSKEQSILNLGPDLIVSSLFSLNNSDVQYKLYNEQNNLIDVADDGQGVPLAGSNSSPKASMERNLSLGDGTLKENWHTARTSINFDSGSTELGSPKTENSKENQAPEIISASVSPTPVVADGQSVVKFQIQIQDPDSDQDINQVVIDLSKISGQEEKMNSLGNGFYNYQLTILTSIGAGEYEIPITVYDGAGNIAESTLFLTVISPTYSDQIIINELYPDPPGSDEDNEFIELKNQGGEAMDLKDWQIQDASTTYKIKSLDFPSVQILAKGFFVIYRNKSGIALNNTGGETVSLLSPDGKIKSSISYSATAPEGQSFSLISSGWSWSQTPTPGQENILSLPAMPNKNPKAVAGDNKKVYINEEITFDGSESYDPDNDPLSYFWNFGDGKTASGATVTNIYTKEGKYTAKLKVEDGRDGVAEDIVSVNVSKKDEKITKKTIKKTKKSTKKKEIKKPKGPFSREVVISEFLPNPKGNDYGNGSKKSGEWIEIKNKGKKEIDLSFWQLDDEQGGSRPYTIENKKIKAGHFLVFYYPEIKINLSNSGDKVRLLDPDGKVVSQIEYGEAEENLSYAQEKNGKWYWTEKPTPDSLNQIIEPKNKEKLTKTKKEEGTIKEEKKSTKTKADEIIKAVSIQEAKEQEKGTKVKIAGTVLVEPGTLGTKIFYLQDANSGIQIYFSKEDFPKLAAGDLITIFGKVSEAGGEKKILVSNKEDINFLSHGAELKAQVLKTGAINETSEGKLVETEGEVVKKIGLTFYLDDGSGQIRVYLSKSANIKKEGIKKGEKIKIKGIVSQTKSGFRILPRYENDILVGEEEIVAAQKKEPGILSNKKLPSVGNDIWILVLLALTLTTAFMLPRLVFSLKKI